MALQTKTFIWGSYAWGSVSNAYVLELTLTENSTSQANNTSEIGYTLKLKSGSQNRFQCDVTSTLKLNGVTVASKTENKYLDYNSTWTLLSGTATVTHDSDGSLDMPISVSIDTADSNEYAPPDKTLEWSWALTAIPRASGITSAEAVELGKACSIRWTPNSSTFRYKLEFSLGDWSYTTAAIHPNRTSAYTYTGYVIPLEVAEQITGDSTGTVTVTLTTYADSDCRAAIGSDTETFTVTVPDNDETRPAVTMILRPADTPMEGIYLQGRSRVQAVLSAEAMPGADIESLSMTVNGKSYASPFLSGYLTAAGQLVVTGAAVDSRGITGYAEQTITVIPYYTPRLTGVAAYRCTSAGQPAENGEYLRIEATRDYAPVTVDGVQRNFCEICFRYKPEGAEGYSDYITVLGAEAAGNSVSTEPLLDATLYRDRSYTVELVAVDAVGKSLPVTVQLSSEAVFRHKRAGGKGMGLGGYCEEDDLLDVHWRGKFRKELEVVGDARIAGNSEAASYNGLYIVVANIQGSTTLTLKTAYSDILEEQTGRQSFFVFGADNSIPVYGLAVLYASGKVSWTGQGNITLQADGSGRLTLTLPAQAWDQLTVLSAKKFSISEEET